ncbi:hypothetical protein B4U80_13814 [Leptotrombidium deliense]|uniref:Uncharacterized protein n=1 Tax=Leptotrombidium deliense TaxID=299467 RepID=A0A443SCY9_9ACAR|nr:hypothetical protein B4U80_13814 [Leptotrombidium deliense]
MNELCSDMIHFINLTTSKETDFLDLFMNYASNVLCTLMYSKNYKVNDPEYVPLRNFLQQLFVSENEILQLLAGKLFGIQFKRKTIAFEYFSSFKQQIYNYMNNIYKERVNSGRTDEFDDLLSAYLKEANGSNAIFFNGKQSFL